jgi:hypothetical protein
MAKEWGFPAVIGTQRDAGKMGYRGCSPWARQGIFIFSSTREGQPDSTTEHDMPGYRPEKHDNANKGLKTVHEFTEAGSPVCIYCVMMREGHDRLIAKLQNGEKW